MILLELTDGTTTLDLAWMLVDYIPRVPEVSETGEVAADALIEDTIKLYVRAGSVEAALDTIRKIENWFDQARRYQRSRAGARLYLRCRVEEASGIYRAEVVDGHTEFLDPPLDFVVHRARSMEISVWIKHRIWEADSETELALYNGSVLEKQLGGVVIYNRDDASSGHQDWVLIAGADIAGVVPAPVRVTLLDTYAGNETFTLYLGHSAYVTNTSNFPHTLQGESGTAGSGVSGTPTADATCSGGNYMALSWVASSEVTLLKWALTAAQIQACAGRHFRVLTRFKTLPSGTITTRLALSLPSALPLMSVSEERVLSTADYLQDLGALQIAPWLAGESSCGPLDFKLLATKSGGGTLDLDFLAIVPADEWRVLRGVGTAGAVQNDTLVDDGVVGLTYIVAAGTNTKTAPFSTFGPPPLLVPGRDQRLYFLAANQVGGSEIDRTHTVRVYYRPRRLTL